VNASEVATAAELCLIDDAGAGTRCPTEVDGYVWHHPGIHYGARVSGARSYDLAKGWV
jgi:hypothetical protein